MLLRSNSYRNVVLARIVVCSTQVVRLWDTSALTSVAFEVLAGIDRRRAGLSTVGSVTAAVLDGDKQNF